MVALILSPPVAIADSTSGNEHHWFVILGSFPQSPTGLQEANALAKRVDQQLAVNNQIVAESAFYPGLTPGLYVVMLGPYPGSASAQQALRSLGIKRPVSDAYVKKALIRAGE